jgi:hypothetical protein
VVLIFQRRNLQESKKAEAGSSEILAHKLWKSRTYDKQYEIGWDRLNNSWYVPTIQNHQCP